MTPDLQQARCPYCGAPFGLETPHKVGCGWSLRQSMLQNYAGYPGMQATNAYQSAYLGNQTVAPMRPPRSPITTRPARRRSLFERFADAVERIMWGGKGR